MVKFENISKYAGREDLIPQRKTECSAGYDFKAAEEMIIPPYDMMVAELMSEVGGWPQVDEPITLDEMAKLTKKTGAKPSLIPTGIKCRLEPNQYLELSIRSSSPLKYWLVLANSEGIIDADYYNNPDNEGHIYFQVINFSPIPLIIKEGDAIGQGIIKTYGKVDDDCATAQRVGGFGSTTA